MSLAGFDTLLAFHLIGLMLGAGGGVGSLLVMRHAFRLPADQARAIRSVGPRLARTSTVGIITMWLSGISLLMFKYGDNLSGLPLMFWVKMAAVTSLTVAVILIEWTYGRVKKGDAAVASRLPRIGPIAGISSLLAVIFAVLTFH